MQNATRLLLGCATEWFVRQGKRRFVREGLWIAAAHGITALAGLISIRIFTELAPREVFGGANLILGMIGLGMNILVAPIAQTQVRYHSAYNDAGEGDAYTRAILGFALRAAIVVITVMCVVLLLWPAGRVGAGLAIAGWLAVWIALSGYRGVLINRLQAERRQNRYAMWLGAEAVLTMLCTAGMLWVWPTIEGYCVGQVSGIGIAVLGFGRIPKRVAVNAAAATYLRHRAWGQITSYGLPFLPFALLGWVSNLADRYVLAANLDVAAVGQYVAAFGIASRLPALLGGFMNDLFRPALFESESRGEGARADRLFVLWLSAVAVSIAVLVSLLYMVGDVVSLLLLAPSYRPGAKEIMCWVATGYGFITLAQVVENKILAAGRSGILMATKFAGAAANLMLAVILIPSGGAMGAAMANAAGQLCQVVLCLAVVTQLRKLATTHHGPAQP